MANEDRKEHRFRLLEKPFMGIFRNIGFDHHAGDHRPKKNGSQILGAPFGKKFGLYQEHSHRDQQKHNADLL